jgi:hypothetical protein
MKRNTCRVTVIHCRVYKPAQNWVTHTRKCVGLEVSWSTSCHKEYWMFCFPGRSFHIIWIRYLPDVGDYPQVTHERQYVSRHEWNYVSKYVQKRHAWEKVQNLVADVMFSVSVELERKLCSCTTIFSLMLICTDIFYMYILTWGTGWRSWLRHCATSRNVAGSIPDGVTGFCHWHNRFGRTMALGSTQPLTEMSIRNLSWGVKAAGA